MKDLFWRVDLINEENDVSSVNEYFFDLTGIYTK